MSLAIYTPVIGAYSETFICSHISSIAPGKTVVIAESELSPSVNSWRIEAPKLVIDNIGAEQCCLGSVGSLLYKKLPIIGGIIKKQTILRFVKKYGVDVFMGEYLDSCLHLHGILKKNNIKYFVHVHGYDLSRNYHLKYNRSDFKKIAEADGIIVVNNIQKGRLLEAGVHPNKIHVIPCGVRVPHNFIRRQNHSKNISCLAVGRMVPKKAPLLLMKSFQIASAKEGSLFMNYIGDGPLKPEVESFVKNNGLDDKVRLWGALHHSDVISMMREADLFLQHSVVDEVSGDEEGLPVAILEAMAHGLPVVSTVHAGVPEAVVSGETGLLSAERDILSMANNICALAQSQELRQRFGRAGWERARVRFSSENEQRCLRKVLMLSTDGQE